MTPFILASFTSKGFTLPFIALLAVERPVVPEELAEEIANPDPQLGHVKEAIS